MAGQAGYRERLFCLENVCVSPQKWVTIFLCSKQKKIHLVCIILTSSWKTYIGKPNKTTLLIRYRICICRMRVEGHRFAPLLHKKLAVFLCSKRWAWIFPNSTSCAKIWILWFGLLSADTSSGRQGGERQTRCRWICCPGSDFCPAGWGTMKKSLCLGQFYRKDAQAPIASQTPIKGRAWTSSINTAMPHQQWAQCPPYLCTSSTASSKTRFSLSEKPPQDTAHVGNPN